LVITEPKTEKIGCKSHKNSAHLVISELRLKKSSFLDQFKAKAIIKQSVAETVKKLNKNDNSCFINETNQKLKVIKLPRKPQITRNSNISFTSEIKQKKFESRNE
jgi:exopolysaccharide biosynthesis protein